MDLSQLLSSEHWFNPNPGSPSIAYSVLAFVFAVVLGASIFLYVRKRHLFGEHSLRLKLAGQAAIIGAVLGAIGLALVFLRFFLVPYLSARFLVYATLIVLTGFVVYYAYYLLRVFPSKLVSYEAQSMRKRYMPKPSPATSRSAKKRSKKRR
ncbi:MAG: hypothetical protein HYY30_03075 [Chloroflexi bacterium]|nr:hypothetical protein [Chloroflexota bacterium]